jgi:microcystin-dependent protein
MSEPFLSQISIVSFNFAPRGWAQCNGQLLPINQNQALFSLLGTTYGGDGRVNFALPDFRGRAPVHEGSHTLGERFGAATHTVTVSELPTHTHALVGSAAAASAATPAGNYLATPSVTLGDVYGPAANLVALDAGTIAATGGSQAHENRQPFLVLNFVIALQGIFPSQT